MKWEDRSQRSSLSLALVAQRHSSVKLDEGLCAHRLEVPFSISRFLLPVEGLWDSFAMPAISPQSGVSRRRTRSRSTKPAILLCDHGAFGSVVDILGATNASLDLG